MENKTTMALTKEDLDSIQLPLSDEDYKMLRREEVRTSYQIWSLASSELREAFEKKQAERVDASPKETWLDRIFRKLIKKDTLMGDVDYDDWDGSYDDLAT